nr:DUF4157 domain-containing protein [Flavobacteriaceae bacterium]
MEGQAMYLQKKTPVNTIGKKKNSFFGGTRLQKKLTIVSTNDAYEVEADRVADQVVGMSDGQINSGSQGSLVQRKCAACEEEGVQKKSIGDSITPLVQRRGEASGQGETSQALTQQINSSKGSGNKMDKGTQSFMESRFGADFSQVRVHTGSEAVQMSKDLNAKAFTVGNDVYFNQGQYNPNSSEGKHLLAHELTHTLQQGGVQKKSIQRSCHDGNCESCTGGIKDFWVTFYFRIRATRSIMSKIRTMINEAKTILANCCLRLKADFNWTLRGGDRDV